MALFRATPLVLSLAAAWPALAAPLPDLDTVQVTAHRTEKPLAETAPNASVLSIHKLNATLANDIADAIKYEPGVEVASDPSRRGNAGYTIRGIDGNRILMLIDGIRLPEAYAGGGNGNGAVSGRDVVELETLRAIDIVKGPTSSLYGSDAIGGVVGYRTKTVDDFVPDASGNGGSIKGFAAGADNSWGSTLSLAAKGEASDAMLIYTHRNGHETANKGSNDSNSTARTTPNPQSWQSDNLLARFGYNPSATQRLELTLESFRRDTDSNLLNTLYPASGGARPKPALQSQQATDGIKRDRVSMGWKGQQMGVFDSLNLRLYQQKLHNSDNSSEWYGNGKRIQSDYGFRQDSSGLLLDAEQRFNALGAEHQLLWGSDISRSETSRPRMKTQYNANGSTSNTIGGETFPSKTFPDSTSHRIGLFVQDEMKFANGLTASPSLRWDQFRMSTQPDQAYYNANPGGSVPDFKDSAFSPRLGLSLPLAEHYTGFVQLSSGFRAPPFDDANMAFANRTYGYQVISNPNLKSETSRGIELGLKGQWDSFDFGLTTYMNRYRDFIEQTSLGTVNGLLTYQYQNVGRVDIKGAEASMSWRFAPGWRSTAAIAYADGRNLDDNSKLTTVAPLSATLGLRYDQATFGGEALLRLVQRNRNVNPIAAMGPSSPGGPGFSAPGYATLDLTAYWQASKNTMLRAGVFNLLDRKYWKAADVRGLTASDPTLDRYSQPGRNVSASLEYSF